MQHDQLDRFQEVTTYTTELVQSYARQIGVSVSAIDLEDGRASGCLDIHLLTITAADASVSVSVPQKELETCLVSEAGEELKVRIAKAVCNLGRQL